MPNLFQHIIITRFNLKVKATNEVMGTIWTKDRNNKEVQTLDWLKTRFNLFETFCLPSVANQSEKDFKWLVYFDTDTPDVFKQKIEEWSKKHTYFTPIYKESYDAFMKEMSSDIKSFCSEKDFVITTRLDNDDSLEKHATQIIKDHFKPIHNTPINLALGYCLRLDAKEQIQLTTTVNLPDGPFVSLIESTDDIQSVYKEKHAAYMKYENVCQVNDQPLWAQIIHEGNMENFMRGKTSRLKDLNDAFGIDNIFLSYNISKEIKHQLRHKMRQIIPLNVRMAIFNFLKKI